MKAISPEELSKAWPRVEAWIAQAVELNQGDENLLDVLIALARGHYTLWVADSFAGVTQTIRYPQQSVMTILYLGGSDLQAIEKAYQFAKQHCQTVGIDVLRVWGRPGWERLLGMKRIAVVLQEDV